MDQVNHCRKLALFDDRWNPRIVGELNGPRAKLVQFRGRFACHEHDHDVPSNFRPPARGGRP